MYLKCYLAASCTNLPRPTTEYCENTMLCARSKCDGSGAALLRAGRRSRCPPPAPRRPRALAPRRGGSRGVGGMLLIVGEILRGIPFTRGRRALFRCTWLVAVAVSPQSLCRQNPEHTIQAALATKTAEPTTLTHPTPSPPSRTRHGEESLVECAGQTKSTLINNSSSNSAATKQPRGPSTLLHHTRAFRRSHCPSVRDNEQTHQPPSTGV
jgi:hypothetical protein